MADLANLAHGVLGKPTFDSESGEWSFSVDRSLEQKIHQILPLQEHRAPHKGESKRNWQSNAILHTEQPWAQVRNVVQILPVVPINAIASELTSFVTKFESDGGNGSLISFGRAVDHQRLSLMATPLIVAIPCGDGGDTLRIIRPRLEKRGWGTKSMKSGAVLSLFVTDASDQAYYKVGTGTAIQQIVFANEEDTTGTWLAVRQHLATTVFRVLYVNDEHTFFPNQVTSLYSSNLKLGSVVVLSTKISGSITHKDVAFNPLYARRFAVVDSSGKWSVWDIEGKHGQKQPFHLSPGKAGGIYDDYIPDPRLKLPHLINPDEWYRILWVCNVSTIIVCSRHHLAVFDIISNPIRLDSKTFLIANGFDMILDMKRSASHLNHVFVLTTSKVFWIEVTPGTGDFNNASCGVKVMLSYKHFRYEQDPTMKLGIIKDDNVSVILYSGQNQIIDFYCFTIEGNSSPRCVQGTFSFSSSDGKWEKAIKSMYFLPVSLDAGTHNAKAAPRLNDLEGVRFVQPWILSSDLGLNSTLCTLQACKGREIKAPTDKVGRQRRGGTRDIKLNSFIVDEPDIDAFAFKYGTVAIPRRHNAADLLMNWTRIYQKVVYEKDSTDILVKTDRLLADLAGRIQLGVENNKFRMGTVLELSAFTKLSENLEQVSGNLNRFLESITDGLAESPSELIITPLISLEYPQELMKIYEDLVDKWMASLPLEVSNISRGSNFRIIRVVAVEICMASIALSIREKASKLGFSVAAAEDILDEHPEANDGRVTRGSSPATFYSSRMSVVPEQSQSQVSSASQAGEIPAVSRLRQYVTTIKPQSNTRQAKLLSEWPLVPGVDPVTYTYKPPATDDSDDERTRAAKRNVIKRKKSMEKLLRDSKATSQATSTRMSEASTQATSVAPSGSQPLERHHLGFSSQLADDLPMTQPNKGPFGSRNMAKKQQKKKKASGFR